ncbi:MAG: hypothetical protein ACJAYE_002566 [Candidatus Azotimanducaceae bacterium]|jgi:hypothetical protein
MLYRYVAVDNLVLLSLEGDVGLVDWRRCFFEMEQLFIQNGYERLLIDGSGLKSFGLSHDNCRHVSPDFVAFAQKAAFFSDNPLVFGMMRVIHSYAFNEAFNVFKTHDDASAFLADRDRQALLA